MADDLDPRVARTRAKALQAAYDLLTEQGFGNVTVEHVSERSGVARSTLYRHWARGDDLMREAFTHVALGGELPAADLREALRLYARTLAHGMNEVWGRALVTLATSAATDPSRRDALVWWTEQNQADVRTLLQRAVDRGELDRLPDVATVTARLFAPLFYRYLFTQLPVTEAFAEEEADRLHDELRRGGPGQRSGNGPEA